VAAGNNRGEIMVWDVPEKKDAPLPQPARKLVGHTNCISRLVATADGRWLISASYDHTIRYWDMQAAANGEAVTVELNERARYEATQRRGAKQPDSVQVKVPTQGAARVLDTHKDWICGFAMSRDQSLLVSGDDAGMVIVWDRESGKQLKQWKVTGWAYAVAFSPDNKEVVVSERIPLIFDRGRHSNARVWDASTLTASTLCRPAATRSSASGTPPTASSSRRSARHAAGSSKTGSTPSTSRPTASGSPLPTWKAPCKSGRSKAKTGSRRSSWLQLDTRVAASQPSSSPITASCFLRENC
jgi:WD40 repeat protein